MLTILNKKILLKLLKEEKINSSSFVKENNISERTFEYNIKKINEILEKINIKICNSGEIYRIKTEEEKKKILSLLEMTQIIDRADRLLMMKFLLFFNLGINLQKFSKKLEISLTTAKKDLNLLKLELEEIEYKKNKGFILKSQIEENKKLELLKEIILNSQVYNYLNNEYENFFSKSEKIIDFLEYVKKDLNIKITSENHLLLQTYILFILSKNEIEPINNNELFIKETEEFKVISDYWKRENIFSANKILKITDLIIGLSIKTNNLENWLNEEILVKKIIKRFSDYVELVLV
ncbi:helix-turn-helix domain-containing protein [Sebaldella sp. S0638]|uniref:helix-turn-helix domain-containing protein n=1 Tax=Sebaldella sp. S0638 TaxID=2957809 RepID=UPI00209DBAEE|nr:HTH domain-containing protein [Sebaldella sp. S0638]MCP1226767.1 helix-turn-helix domain-containing protein [Sebaldella sp. S0638]